MPSFVPDMIALDNPTVSSMDPVLMTRIALGEAGGAAIWGAEGRAWDIQAKVIWVARNRERWAQGPAPFDPRMQFYGWQEEITEADVERTRAVLEAPMAENPIPHMLFVLSEQDRLKLDFPEGDIAEYGVAPFALHFYGEDAPWGQ